MPIHKKVLLNGNSFYTARRAGNLSAEDFANAIDVSVRTVRRLEQYEGFVPCVYSAALSFFLGHVPENSNVITPRSNPEFYERYFEERTRSIQYRRKPNHPLYGKD